MLWLLVNSRFLSYSLFLSYPHLFYIPLETVPTSRLCLWLITEDAEVRVLQYRISDLEWRESY